MACAGGTWQICRAAMVALIRQHGECKCFFGIFRHTQFSRSQYLDPRQARRELRHDDRVVRASAGDDKFVNLYPWQHPAAQSFEDGERSEQRRGVEGVFRAAGALADPVERALRVGIAELFAPRGFWRPHTEVGVLEQGGEKRRLETSSARHSRVAIKA